MLLGAPHYLGVLSVGTLRNSADTAISAILTFLGSLCGEVEVEYLTNISGGQAYHENLKNISKVRQYHTNI